MFKKDGLEFGTSEYFENFLKMDWEWIWWLEKDAC